MRDRLLDRPAVAVAVPQPDRGGQVLDADHDADEAPGLARVVSGPDLEHHLVLVAEVDPLHQPALRKAPEVEVVAEALAEQVLGIQPVLDHRRRRPLRGHRDVLVQVPPDVVGEVLVATVGLPGARDLEGVVIDQRDPAGPVAVAGGAEVRHEDAARPAMHRVRARVAGLGSKLLGLDRPHDVGLTGIGLGVEHIGARRADPGHDQVAALEHALVALVAERAGAGVPAEVMQLVAGGRKLGPSDHVSVAGRATVTVDHGHRVALFTGRVVSCDVGEALGRRRDRGCGRAVEGGIGRLGHRNSHRRRCVAFNPTPGLRVAGCHVGIRDRLREVAGGRDYGVARTSDRRAPPAVRPGPRSVPDRRQGEDLPKV